MIRSIMFVLLASLLTSFMFTLNVKASPSGAPPSICYNMTPGHEFDPQTIDQPFETTLDKVNRRIMMQSTHHSLINLYLYIRRNCTAMEPC